MWFKEYVFNLIIQPFHLLLYTILVGTAINLATESLIYAVVAIYFVIPAEKLLRKFFGFDNAGTLSAAGSFAGGALFSAMISRINKPKSQDGKDDEEKPRNTRKSSGNSISNSNEQIFGRELPDATNGGGRSWWLAVGGGSSGGAGQGRWSDFGGGSAGGSGGGRWLWWNGFMEWRWICTRNTWT